MRIQHNIAAMNSYRNYTANNKAVAKNLEKLSSGYKINRAGDDAAGLAISEKMRAQITGIKTAQKNAKDGISLVQTAEGALTEVHSMLNRMVELADQSANGTYDNEVDRANLQKEVTALSTEIDRIADSSNFNGIKLLDGSLASSASNAASAGKQLMNIGSSVVGATAGRQDASSAVHVFAGDVSGKDKSTNLFSKTEMDAYKLEYTNDKGEKKTILLAEKAVDSMGATGGDGVSKLAAAIANGNTTGLTITDKNGNASNDLAEFNRLFNVSGKPGGASGAGADELTISAKDGASGAQLTSFSHASAASTTAAIDAVKAPGLAPMNETGNPASVLTSTKTGADGSGVDLVDATKFDLYEISFINSKGESKTITVGETAVDSIGKATGNGNVTGLKDALTGTNAAFTAVGTDGLATSATDQQKADFAEFKSLFTGTATAGTATTSDSISFAAKTGDTVSHITSFKHGADTTLTNAVTALGTATSAISGRTQSTVAEKAGYSIDFDAGSTTGGNKLMGTGKTLTVGSHKYEFVDVGGKPTGEGNIAIIKGENDAATTENLVAQLKKDGFSVDISANDKAKITFTNMDQLKEKQVGQQVETNADNLFVEKQVAVKQSVKIDFAQNTSHSAGVQKLTINYVDGEGKAQSKELSYQPAEVAADNAKAIANVIKSDKDLSALFDVKYTDGATAMTIESRGTGEGAATFSGMVSTDVGANATGTQHSVAGKVEGKTLTAKEGTSVAAGSTVTVDGKTYEFSSDSTSAVGSGNTRVMIGDTTIKTMQNLSDKLNETGVKHSFDTGTGKLTFADRDAAKGTGGLTLQIGDTAESFNKLTVSVNDMHTKALGIGSLDITDQTKGAAAVEKLRTAINTVSSTRGDLGATQNRLDHTINNLTVMHENIQDAEASIRDVDVADEMMAYTKNNILVQSAQAMLAQANQLPQGVLQLLQ